MLFIKTRIQERRTDCGEPGEWRNVIFREILQNILGILLKHVGECCQAFRGMSSNISGSVLKQFGECCQTFEGMSPNIPANVARYSGECPQTFDLFCFYNVLLNNTNDPDKNIFNDLSQIDSVFCAVKEAAASLKKFNDKTFSVLQLNVRRINQNFESFKELLTNIKAEFKVICLTGKWRTDDPRNETLFSLENYTSSINQGRKHGRGNGIRVFLHNSLTFEPRSDLATNSNDIDSLTIEIINKKKQKCCH